MGAAVLALGFSSAAVGARQATGRSGGAPPATQAAPIPNATNAITPPPDYVIGPDDVLTVLFWRDKEMTVDVTVRPDGKISVPLLNDVQAAGLTPEQLRQGLVAAAKAIMAEPTITVSVKAINSRFVSITGAIAKQGPYAMTEGMTLLELITRAGGLQEFADKKHIVIIRREKKPNGEPVTLTVNYKDLANLKDVTKNNVVLKPGDQVIVKQ
jgi:polysaccharide export outer membrane protein